MKKILVLAMTLVMVLLFSFVVFAGDAKKGEASLASQGEDNYLTFTAEEDNSGVILNYFNGSNIMCSTDGGSTWNDYTKGTAVILLKTGDSIKFKGTDIKTDVGHHFDIAGRVAATGDVTSLTNGFGQDGTKGGMKGRKERLRRKAEKQI